jgi:hypothetical protein
MKPPGGRSFAPALSVPNAKPDNLSSFWAFDKGTSREGKPFLPKERKPYP